MGKLNRDQLIELGTKIRASEGDDEVLNVLTRNKEDARRLIDKVSKDMDPDHSWELQLDGIDHKRNLKLMDWFTNRRMGTNIANQMKSVPYGSRIKITVER